MLQLVQVQKSIDQALLLMREACWVRWDSTCCDVPQKLGVKKALVVHSMGLDELTPLGDASVVEVTPGGVRRYRLDPSQYGIPRCEVADLAGGDAALNAAILRVRPASVAS